MSLKLTYCSNTSLKCELRHGSRRTHIKKQHFSVSVGKLIIFEFGTVRQIHLRRCPKLRNLNSFTKRIIAIARAQQTSKYNC